MILLTRRVLGLNRETFLQVRLHIISASGGASSLVAITILLWSTVH